MKWRRPIINSGEEERSVVSGLSSAFNSLFYKFGLEDPFGEQLNECLSNSIEWYSNKGKRTATADTCRNVIDF